MLDALRTGEDEIPTSRLTVDEIEALVRAFDLPPTPANVLALGWALGRGEFGPFVVVRSSDFAAPRIS